MNDNATAVENAKGMKTILRMINTSCQLKLAEEKVYTVKEALEIIQKDYADNNITSIYLIEREVNNLTFEGPGKMKLYIDKLKELLQKLSIAGEPYSITKTMIKLKADLGSNYDSVTMNMKASMKLTDVYKELIDMNDVMIIRQEEEKKETVALKAEMNALKIELEALRTTLPQRQPNDGGRGQTNVQFDGKCYECNKYGHRQINCSLYKRRMSVEKNNNKIIRMYIPSLSITHTRNSENNHYGFVLDSGATHHFSPENVYLEDFRLSIEKVKVANGNNCQVLEQVNYIKKIYSMPLLLNLKSHWN